MRAVQGFSSVYKPRRQGAKTFADLLHEVADVDPEMRIRFMSPHPKDFGPDVLQVPPWLLFKHHFFPDALTAENI